MKPVHRYDQDHDQGHDTNFGWWTDKPVREDRGTSFTPLIDPPSSKGEPVWIKSAVILTIIFVFGLSLLRLFNLVP